MAELNINVLEWVQAYLHETGHPEDAAQVRLAIAALEDRDRLLRASQELVHRGPQSGAWEPFFDLVAELSNAWKPPAALEGRDG